MVQGLRSCVPLIGWCKAELSNGDCSTMETARQWKRRGCAVAANLRKRLLVSGRTMMSTPFPEGTLGVKYIASCAGSSCNRKWFDGDSVFHFFDSQLGCRDCGLFESLSESTVKEMTTKGT